MDRHLRPANHSMVIYVFLLCFLLLIILLSRKADPSVFITFIEKFTIIRSDSNPTQNLDLIFAYKSNKNKSDLGPNKVLNASFICIDRKNPTVNTCSFKAAKVLRCNLQISELSHYVMSLDNSICNAIGESISKFPDIFIGSNVDVDLHLAFARFKEKYGYQFDFPFDVYRYSVFRENFFKVLLLQHIGGGHADYGMTKFFHLTQEEFKSIYTPHRWNLSDRPLTRKIPSSKTPLPDSFDWRARGAVTEVKNQGQCGSCWAFSVTGNIEGVWAARFGVLNSLSEQELLDCDKLDDGCSGGLPVQAYKAILTIGGLEYEEDYPYTAKEGQCHYKRSIRQVFINGSISLSENEDELTDWLVHNSPISIGINSLALQFYLKGIIHIPNILCWPFTIDHGVLIVGYGVGPSLFHHSVPYWIVKNSWGIDWGESGYFRIYRGGGTCGLNKMCSSAEISTK